MSLFPSAEAKAAFRELLRPVLPTWHENREQWPLWTYDRSPRYDDEAFRAQFRGEIDSDALRATWRGCTVWSERFRWAPAHLIREDPDEQLQPIALSEQMGSLRFEQERLDRDQEQRGPPPDDVRQALEADESTTEIELLDLSTLSRASLAAICGQTGPELPDKLGDIDLPVFDNWWGLELEDFRELAFYLAYQLMKPRSQVEYGPAYQEAVDEQTDWDPEQLTLVDEESDAPPPLSLFDQMTELHSRFAAAGRTSDEQTDQARSLAVQLCREAGLLPSRKGGSMTVLDDERLLQLDEEAREIVASVRDWTPSEEMESHVRTLIAAQLPDDDNRAVLERERLRRRPLRETSEGWRAWHVRFPFLTAEEIQAVLYRTEGEWMDTSTAAAEKLVLGRLPLADVSANRDSYRVRLSNIRN